jgi:cation diffusion facilitator CzcD-associated flavoprotein CzcO
VKIAIIGAGFAGLSSAKVLKQFGHEVTVFEKTPDVGGVWSASRRYPGVTTQNNKGTYHLSDYPMPASYPEFPSGEQVQAYLEGYADRFGVTPHLRLNTEVLAADLDEVRGLWSLTSRETGADERRTEEFEYLVVANGIFSEPFKPSFGGADDHERAGGRLYAASEFADLEEARGKDVVVVGYGKSACDVAFEISGVAASTTVVARRLLWKMPKKLGNLVSYKYLMLTRMGEGLFPYIEARGFERFLHGVGKPVRNSMLGAVQWISVKQLRLRQLGLVPEGGFERIARSTVSLTTDGFYERVAQGRISVLRDRTVVRLLEKDGRPCAELSTGEVIPADVVVCGTGFRQVIPFFSDELQKRLTDERGDFMLHQYIQPLDVPRLSFVGYNSSFFSPLSAEVAALWVANYLMGGLELPPVEERRRRIAERLRWMRERTEGQHARGTNIIPFSMHNIDETLEEMGLNVGPATRALQWLLPPNPGSYRKVTARLLARQRELQSKGLRNGDAQGPRQDRRTPEPERPDRTLAPN